MWYTHIYVYFCICSGWWCRWESVGMSMRVVTVCLRSSCYKLLLWPTAKVFCKSKFTLVAYWCLLTSSSMRKLCTNWIMYVCVTVDGLWCNVAAWYWCEAVSCGVVPAATAQFVALVMTGLSNASLHCTYKCNNNARGNQFNNLLLRICHSLCSNS